ncbi:DUF3000 domain-containing protein [Glutamicibacter sp. MNS18]|uniref:DUF3000 domain-containing protein n=1 Tax=Glutamicibacter sp. MNS18 TaxID=2989817 RepID=UPI0022360B3A|nr:DUF3000 domain-containing protein [Glutamicibacter sp. MNS18]MCW4464498.1 DUF3000 domain-containing protein [Glutamicibacter sp. MNS18]
MNREQQRPPVPQAFTQALAGLSRAKVRQELRIIEIPAPQRLAPFALALSGEVTAVAHPRHGEYGKEFSRTPFLSVDQDLATGRFILLYDPESQDLWNGNFRVVTYIRARLDEDMGQDPMLASVAWSWFEDALRGREAPYHSAGGTATRVISESFGQLAHEETSVDVELRVSWSPSGTDLGPHLSAWADMVCTFAGLPPLPDGVQQLPMRRLS